MSHKVEAIDYLRGLSILAIILLHTILLAPNDPLTKYSSIPALSNLRDILNFSVVTIVLCSGFSLYLSTKNISLGFNNISSFFKKRIKKLMLPWLIVVGTSILFFFIINIFFKPTMQHFNAKHTVSSLLNLAGLPLAWIANRWIIWLMILLTFLFPFLKYIYEKYRFSFHILVFLYIIASIISIKNPIDIFQYPFLDYFSISVISAIITFILGWSIIYLLGFYLERLYNNKKLFKKELKLTINFILLFIGIHLIYNFFKIDINITTNKFPPYPYYLSYGVAASFLLLTLFFAYKHFIHIHFRKMLYFFSSGSYWLFLWSYLTLVVFSYLFSLFDFINIYLLLTLEFIANCILVSIIVLLQKKLIKIKIHLEKHHF